MTHTLGGKVERADKREYGETDVKFSKSVLFDGFGDENVCLMSHTDYVDTLPEGFERIAYTQSCPYAGIENKEKHFKMQYARKPSKMSLLFFSIHL